MTMAMFEVSSGRIRCTIAWTAQDFSKALLRNSHAFLKTRSVELQATDLAREGFRVEDCIAFVNADGILPRDIQDKSQRQSG